MNNGVPFLFGNAFYFLLIKYTDKIFYLSNIVKAGKMSAYKNVPVAGKQTIWYYSSMAEKLKANNSINERNEKHERSIKC